jgi:uncharacterized protein (DUF302 family)
MTLFAVIDHSGEAAAVGLDLRNTRVVVFGSPRAGTPVMEAVPLATLDLPLRLLVWDDEHETQLAYFSPEALGGRFGLNEKLVGRLTGIDAVTDAVTDGELAGSPVR